MSRPSVETARGWQTKPVVGRDGEPLGRITHIYIDRSTGEPTWALVARGRLARHEAFVPLALATDEGNRVRVLLAGSTVEEAPHVRAGGELSGDDEVRLSQYYGEPTGVARSGARRGFLGGQPDLGEPGVAPEWANLPEPTGGRASRARRIARVLSLLAIAGGVSMALRSRRLGDPPAATRGRARRGGRAHGPAARRAAAMAAARRRGMGRPMAGPPWARRRGMGRPMAGPPWARRMAGPPWARRTAGPPWARRMTGPPWVRQMTGPPWARRMTGSPLAGPMGGPMGRGTGRRMRRRMRRRMGPVAGPQLAGRVAAGSKAARRAAPDVATRMGRKAAMRRRRAMRARRRRVFLRRVGVPLGAMMAAMGARKRRRRAARARLMGAGMQHRGMAMRRRMTTAMPSMPSVGMPSMPSMPSVSMPSIPSRPHGRRRSRKMAGKFRMLVGFAAGYVLGAKAGRERYEQIVTQAKGLWERPEVQKMAAKGRETLNQGAQRGAGVATDRMERVRSAVSTHQPGSGGQPAHDGEEAMRQQGKQPPPSSS
jgi:hypothetical protein